jgi:hypothetical protein
MVLPALSSTHSGEIASIAAHSTTELQHIWTKDGLMAPDYTKPPLSNFAPPGVVKVSAAALEQARQFAEDISRVKPDDDWVISFEWAESRAIRRRVDGPREELGAGLALVVYDRSDLPPEVIQTAGDLEFAIKIPSQVWQQSELRTIDIDETVLWRVTLR